MICDPEYFRRLGLRSESEARDAIRALESLRNNLARSQPITVHDWPQIVRMTRLVAGTEE